MMRVEKGGGLGLDPVIRVQRNIINRVWYFGMVWEADIYSRTAGNDRCPALERLTYDNINIYEWLKFKFYDLVWFCRVFRYLQNKLGKNPGRMTYDPMYEPTDENVFEVVGRDFDKCKDFYPDAQ